MKPRNLCFFSLQQIFCTLLKIIEYRIGYWNDMLYANVVCYGYILPMARSNCAWATLKSLRAP